MKKKIDQFNAAFVDMAEVYVKRIGHKMAGVETYTPELPGGPLRWGMTLADEVRVANLLAVTVGKMQNASGGDFNEVPGEPETAQTLGPGMVFQNGRAHVQDGPITANLGQGAYFRMENTPASAPCDPPDGVTVEVWDRLKNLCEFCKEMSKRGGIWAARSWGIDAVALEFVIDWIEGTQAAQEAAQNVPEAAVGTDTFRATEEAAQNAWEAVRDILAGKRQAPDGAVFNVTVDLAGSPKTIRTGTEQDAAGGVILKTHSGEEVLLKTPEEAFALAGCIQEMASRVWPWPKGGN